MNLNYLKDKHRNSLVELLQKYEEMFDGAFGKYTGSDYTVKFKEDAKLYHAKPYPILKFHEPFPDLAQVIKDIAVPTMKKQLG